MGIQVIDIHGNERDLQWLQDTYKVEVLNAGPGPKFQLIRVEEVEGPAVFMVQVRDRAGRAQVNQPVANHWPGVETADNARDLRNADLQTLWRNHAIVQTTNSNGDTGYGYGGGSVIRQDGGPHTLWVLSPSLPSDGLTRVGWLGGTNHRGPTRLTFQIMDAEQSGEDEGPEGGDESGPTQPTADLVAKLDAIHRDLRRLMAHLGLDRE